MIGSHCPALRDGFPGAFNGSLSPGYRIHCDEFHPGSIGGRPVEHHPALTRYCIYSLIPMYVCMYVCMYVYMYVFMCVYHKTLSLYMHVCMYLCVCTARPLYLCIMYVCMYTCIFVCTTYVCMYLYVCTTRP